MFKKYIFTALTVLLPICFIFVTACTSQARDPGQPALPDTSEVIVYDWTNDIPDEVLQGFEKETGIKVTFITYESQEEAIRNMKDGQVYDVVVLDSQFIPGVIQGEMVREIDYENVPNIKYISANFRDLIYDPGNRYSIPYNWGTTGLVVREDLVKTPVTRWDDLWNQAQTGKVLIWRGVERQMMGLALKSLGYSVNSENPAELEQAAQKIMALKPNAIFGEDKDESLESSAPILVKGEVVMAVGWSHDVLEGRKDNPAIQYVLPSDGALLWGDNFVITAKSPHPLAAEMFLNYVLRPEVSAKITNYNSYPSANEKASRFITPEILNDPVVFPKNDELKNAEIILPLSAEGEKLHNQLWERFLAAP